MEDRGEQLLRELLAFHEIHEGKHEEICSIDNFLTSSGSLPLERKKGVHLEVFWFPEKDDESELVGMVNAISRNVNRPETIVDLGQIQFQFPFIPPSNSPRGIREKIKSVLLGVKLWSDSILLQFWAPVEVGGQIFLETSDQPFGLGGFYKGLCRYRLRCLNYTYVIDGWENESSQLGPLGRVFKQGSPEFCPNLKCYMAQEFPLRDFAIQCGIEGYWALPLFEPASGGQQQHCLGVLEFVAFKTMNVVHHVNPVFEELEVANLKCPSSYFHECNKIRRNLLSPRVDIKQVLDFVREVHQLPLIQAWVPCMCDHHDPEAYVRYDGNSYSSSDAGKTTELFCEMRSCDRNIKYISDIIEFKHKYGTCSVQKGKGCVGKAYSFNKPFFLRDSSQLSISDYPFVHLTRRAGFTGCFAIPLQCVHPKLDTLLLEIFLPREQTYDRNEVTMMKSLLSTVAHGFSRLNVALGLKQGEEFSVEVSHRDDKLDCFCIRRSSGNLNRHEALESGRKELQFQTSHQPPTRENNVTIDKVNATVRKRHSSVTHTIKTQDRVENSLGVYTNAEARITMDVLKPHFGRNIVDAAESLGVSRSTLKRICRSLGVSRWPSHKRKKADQINSSPGLLTGPVDVGEEVIQESEGRCQEINALEKEAAALISTLTSANGKSIALGDETDHNCTIIVKATCKDNIVMFPLSSNSGIEYLSHELAKRFKLKYESFTIKYEDEEGDWIMIPCDEDLRYRMETLKSLGQSRIKLSVFPVTP